MDTPYIVNYEEFDYREHIAKYVDHSTGKAGPSGICWLEMWKTMLDTVPAVEGRILDLGTGASVFPLILTSRTAGEIIATGYLEGERQELQKWLDGDADVVNMGPCLEYAAKLEGNGTTASDIETRLKEKVKAILPCDVTKDNPLHPADMGQFGVVTSNLILTAACLTEEAFSDAVKNISQLISPGGRTIMLSVFDTDYYFVGDKKFFSMPLTREFLEKVLFLHGFEDVSLQMKWMPRKQKPTEVLEFVIFHAVKKVH